ncbi:MAG TPA: LemA family protein [Actinomycetota bacterium]
MTIWYVGGGLGLLVLLVVVSFNRFVRQRNLILTSWSDVDTELRRRYDLIPNLVETVKGYAAHERAVFEEVTRARTEAMGATGLPEQQAAAEGPLVGALRRLLAVSEAYPELQASGHFHALQDELTTTEDRIQAARRFYNSNVQEYNRRVQAFPSNLIAALFSFKRSQFFHIDAAIRPDVERAPRVS